MGGAAAAPAPTEGRAVVPPLRTWRGVVADVLPGPAPRIVELIAARWQGANLYLPARIARCRWRGRDPHGAAEQFASDLIAAVLAHGGTRDNARVVLAALVGRRFVV